MAHVYYKDIALAEHDDFVQLNCVHHTFDVTVTLDIEIHLNVVLPGVQPVYIKKFSGVYSQERTTMSMQAPVVLVWARVVHLRKAKRKYVKGMAYIKNHHAHDDKPVAITILWFVNLHAAVERSEIRHDDAP